jgi:hypothetical protein
LDELEILKPSLLAVYESYLSYQREEQSRKENKDVNHFEPSAPDEKYEGLMIHWIHSDNDSKKWVLIMWLVCCC